MNQSRAKLNGSVEKHLKGEWEIYQVTESENALSWVKQTSEEGLPNLGLFLEATKKNNLSKAIRANVSSFITFDPASGAKDITKNTDVGIKFLTSMYDFAIANHTNPDFKKDFKKKFKVSLGLF